MPVSRLAGMLFVTVLLFAPLAQADLLFVGEDNGGGLYEFDTDIGESSGTNYPDFSSVNGLASDGKNLFVSKGSRRSIVKFSPDGSSETFAQLDSISGGPAFDPDGNLFVPYQIWGHQTGKRIDKISPDGQTITVFTTNVMSPGQLAFDKSGNLFCADQKAGCIYEFDSDGRRTTFAKNVKPLGLAFDGNGNLFAKSSGTILKFAPDGTQTVFARLKSVSGLAFDSKGDLFASDGKGSVFEYEMKNGYLSPKPVLFAQNLGRDGFITVMPGKLQTPSVMVSSWIWWTVAAVMVVVAASAAGILVIWRKKKLAIAAVAGASERN